MASLRRFPVRWALAGCAAICFSGAVYWRAFKEQAPFAWQAGLVVYVAMGSFVCLTRAYLPIMTRQRCGRCGRHRCCL